MTPPTPPPLDARLLLEHAPWMRRLARSLVGDAERAEDLSQETWRRLLERPPRLDRPFRGWIATVMRNLVRAERRGSARRAAREAASARTESEPSSLELLERATLQRELVQAVLELEEPYRTTLLLRYFEDRAPQEIAAREDLPLATVKTRLARGTARLRERLGRTLGPDGRVSVLVALTRIEAPRGAPPWLPWTVTTIAMNTKILVPLGLTLAAGLAWFLLPREGTPEVSETHTASGARPAQGSPTAASPSSTEAPRATPARDAVWSTPPAAVAEAVREARVRGRVIDLSGAGVGGVAIALATLQAPPRALSELDQPAEAVAQADDDGAFEFARPRRGHLFVRDPLWTTVLAGVPVDDRSGQECRILVARRLELAGIVIDESGVPLPAARLTLEPPADLRARLEEVLDFSVEVEWGAASEDSGRFRIAPGPAFADGRLRVELEGFSTLEEPAPQVSRNDLVFVLRRPPDQHRRLLGRVVDGAQAPVAEAYVALGVETTRSDEAGRFVFELDDPDSLNRRVAGFARAPEDLLRALKQGHLPGELRAPERDAEGRPLWPSPVVLQLGGAPASIGGWVVDEHGQALAGMRVWIADPLLFGGILGRQENEYPRFAHLESLLAGDGPGWTWAESDPEGRFELGGLTEREYLLAAMDPATLLRTLEPNIVAGRRDVTLVLPQGQLFPRLAGRIVDSRANPVPHVNVFPMCDALVTRLEGQTMGTQHEVLEGALTDEDGRFLLERVPKDLVYLRIQGSDTLPLEWGRGAEGGLERLVGTQAEELVITVERRCHFQVELSVPSEADALGVLDADGNELVISLFLGSSRNDTERHPILDGRSSALAVGDRAATLVLYRAGVEVRRVPVRLEPEEPASLKL